MRRFKSTNRKPRRSRRATGRRALAGISRRRHSVRASEMSCDEIWEKEDELMQKREVYDNIDDVIPLDSVDKALDRMGEIVWDMSTSEDWNSFVLSKRDKIEDFVEGLEENGINTLKGFASYVKKSYNKDKNLKDIIEDTGYHAEYTVDEYIRLLRVDSVEELEELSNRYRSPYVKLFGILSLASIHAPSYKKFLKEAIDTALENLEANRNDSDFRSFRKMRSAVEFFFILLAEAAYDAVLLDMVYSSETKATLKEIISEYMSLDKEINRLRALADKVC